MSIYILLLITTPLLSYQNKKGLIIPFREFSYYIGLVYQTTLTLLGDDEGKIGTETHPHLHYENLNSLLT